MLFLLLHIIAKQQCPGYLSEMVLKSLSSESYAIKSLMGRGADINYYSSTTDELPLVQAVKYGYEEAVAVLVQNGANYNVTLPDGTPLILHAIKHDKYRRIVYYLFGLGIPIDTCDRNGATALMYAIEADELTLVEWLVDRGADVNRIGSIQGGYISDLMTPLTLAVKKSLKDVVRLLFSTEKLVFTGSEPAAAVNSSVYKMVGAYADAMRELLNIELAKRKINIKQEARCGKIDAIRLLFSTDELDFGAGLAGQANRFAFEAAQRPDLQAFIKHRLNTKNLDSKCCPAITASPPRW